MSHPVPYELAKLRGFPGKRKMHPGPQPARTEQVPEPPEGLAGDARDAWLYLAPRLHRTGLLSEIDTIAFEVLCRSVGHWRAIERQIAEAGPVTPGPYLKAVMEAAAAVLRAGAAFGLDPAARVRLAAGGHNKAPDAGDDRWTGLLA